MESNKGTSHPNKSYPTLHRFLGQPKDCSSFTAGTYARGTRDPRFGNSPKNVGGYVDVRDVPHPKKKNRNLGIIY